tara:strand:+ start:3419 stop:4303 length:885 start_codon:yes stop_codon:yes gene_type:complete
MKLSNQELNQKLIDLSRKERVLVNEILDHLKEVQKRRLYAKLAYSSLFEYCVKELKMSEGSAGRKIAAMRMITEVPEMEEKLKSGSMHLSTLSMAQRFFKHEPYTKPEKVKLLTSLAGKSKREVEKRLCTLSPKMAKRTDVRQISEEHTRMSITLNKEQKAILDRLKELKGMREEDLLDWMLERCLKQVDPLKKKPRKTKAKPKARHIPMALKKALYERDGGRCQFKVNGKQCHSRHGLQVDHKKPYALGGRTELENLRLLCPEHNRLMAIRVFGENKMARHLSNSPGKCGEAD